MDQVGTIGQSRKWPDDKNVMTRLANDIDKPYIEDFRKEDINVCKETTHQAEICP